MTESTYLMRGHEPSVEQRRLRGLEMILDSGTDQLLAHCPPLAGASCLEVGPGAGSVARRLRSLVGPSGRVVAIDLEPALMLDSSGIEVVKADITDCASIVTEQFDLVHTRAVIEHTSDPITALTQTASYVRPGGTTIVECLVAPYENIVPPDDPIGAARKAVHDRMTSLGAESGLDFRFGYRLPWLLHDLGFRVDFSEIRQPIFAGGDERSDFYRFSFEYLKDLFLAEGTVSAELLQAYVDSATDSSHFQSGPMLLAVVATRVSSGV